MEVEAMKTVVSGFYKKNIEHKKIFMQEEHEKVLQFLYDKACDQKAVEGFELRENLIPVIPYSHLMEEFSDVDKYVLDVCLSDLRYFGFADRTMTKGRVEYTITKLGLKYMEYEQIEAINRNTGE